MPVVIDLQKVGTWWPVSDGLIITRNCRRDSDGGFNYDINLHIELQPLDPQTLASIEDERSLHVRTQGFVRSYEPIQERWTHGDLTVSVRGAELRIGTMRTGGDNEYRQYRIYPKPHVGTYPHSIYVGLH
jgi:hypothetical protein